MTAAELRRRLPTLDDAAWRRLAGPVLRLPEGELAREAVVAAYVFEWLTHLGCFTESQVRWLLGAYRYVAGAGATIIVADGRLVVWTGTAGWHDAEAEVVRPGERIPRPMTTVALDVEVMLARKENAGDRTERPEPGH